MNAYEVVQRITTLENRNINLRSVINLLKGKADPELIDAIWATIDENKNKIKVLDLAARDAKIKV